MTELEISGMTCDACATHVRHALEKVPGVRSVQVSVPEGRAWVTLATGTLTAACMKAVVSAVMAVGYRAHASAGRTDPLR